MAFPIKQGLFQFDLIDHYAILGVPIDADSKEIRQRYLKIAYRLHPDTCRANNPVEKEQAGQLFSKLVNPAYEHLSREQSRVEFRLVIAQIGKGLAQNFSKTTLVSEPAKKLIQTSSNIESVYRKLIQPLAVDQYLTLDGAYLKIAQISELNLVYLMLTEEQAHRKTATFIGASALSTSATQTHSGTTETPKSSEELGAISSYLRRAQDALKAENYSQVILEIRDALKIEPNHSTCHALLGLAYLRQNQTAMARVHINQALKANPNDPIAIQSKKELDQTLNPNIAMQGGQGKKDNTKDGKNFWTLFNGKKK